MKSGEKFSIAVIIGLVLFIAGNIAFHSRSSNPVVPTINGNTLSYQQLAAIYEDMGITGVTDEIVKELETIQKQGYYDPDDLFWNKPADLLCWIGQSGYNDTVYSFDTEVFEVSTMYTNFLTRVSYLGNGELEFENIVEDLSHVDKENDSGYRTVSFDWNGEQFTLTAQEMHDWFDLDFGTQLNEIIMTHGNGKRLYFTDDNYQSLVVFYRDDQWANEFTFRTGCKLSTDCTVGSVWKELFG